MPEASSAPRPLDAEMHDGSFVSSNSPKKKRKGEIVVDVHPGEGKDGKKKRRMRYFILRASPSPMLQRL